MILIEIHTIYIKVDKLSKITKSAHHVTNSMKIKQREYNNSMKFIKIVHHVMWDIIFQDNNVLNALI